MEYELYDGFEETLAGSGSLSLNKTSGQTSSHQKHATDKKHDNKNKKKNEIKASKSNDKRGTKSSHTQKKQNVLNTSDAQSVSSTSAFNANHSNTAESTSAIPIVFEPVVALVRKSSDSLRQKTSVLSLLGCQLVGLSDSPLEDFRASTEDALKDSKWAQSLTAWEYQNLLGYLSKFSTDRAAFMLNQSYNVRPVTASPTRLNTLIRNTTLLWSREAKRFFAPVELLCSQGFPVRTRFTAVAAQDPNYCFPACSFALGLSDREKKPHRNHWAQQAGNSMNVTVVGLVMLFALLSSRSATDANNRIKAEVAHVVDVSDADED